MFSHMQKSGLFSDDHDLRIALICNTFKFTTDLQQQINQLGDCLQCKTEEKRLYF